MIAIHCIIALKLSVTGTYRSGQQMEQAKGFLAKYRSKG